MQIVMNYKFLYAHFSIAIDDQKDDKIFHNSSAIAIHNFYNNQAF